MSTASPTIRRREGFTIVELLIVIVVIGILAAITIVAYNGIQTRAKIANDISVVSSYQRAFQLMKADTGSVPTYNGCLGPASAYPSGCSMGGQSATSQAAINNALTSYGMTNQPQLSSIYKSLMYSPGFYGANVIIWDFPTDQDCGASSVFSPNSSGVWGFYGAKYSGRGSVSTFCAVSAE